AIVVDASVEPANQEAVVEAEGVGAALKNAAGVAVGVFERDAALRIYRVEIDDLDAAREVFELGADFVEVRLLVERWSEVGLDDDRLRGGRKLEADVESEGSAADGGGSL